MNQTVTYVPSAFGGRRIEVRHQEDNRVTLLTAGEDSRSATLAVEHLVDWGATYDEATHAVVKAFGA